MKNINCKNRDKYETSIMKQSIMKHNEIKNNNT